MMKPEREFNHNDMMDSALAPIEAQRDDALEELFAVKTERDALLAIVTELAQYDGMTGSLPDLIVRAKEVIDAD